MSSDSPRMHHGSTLKQIGRHDVGTKAVVGSSSSPGHSTMYPTTRMTTEENKYYAQCTQDGATEFFKDDTQLGSSPDHYFHGAMGCEIIDDLESQDSIVLQTAGPEQTSSQEHHW